ncbi:MAG: SpoIIE family protein phosphatase [Gemmatimonadetes bacterium]|nr:SpoIIE family protein phosphatase [Gemmatimonadota bacterium]
MSGVREVLAAFRAATSCPASLWREDAAGLACLAHDADALPEGPPASVRGTTTADWKSRTGDPRIVAPVDGLPGTWLVLGPAKATRAQLDQWAAIIGPAARQAVTAARELEQAARELAERYEEINLLYTINEILGRTVALDEAAQIILQELLDTVGARRGALFVHDRAALQLIPVATAGIEGRELPPIALDDTRAVSARVFASHQAVIAGRDLPGAEAEGPVRRGEMLAVPILWTAPGGGDQPPMGVVVLSDRKGREPFSAGDQKLVTAVATQIGTAIQNARPVRDSLLQERLQHEMALAHDLQMKMLPDVSIVAPIAEVGARVAPAEDVGGDFYNLFRLGPNRTGAMVGDVSSHGYRAALIMALAMSAATIHAPRTADPGEVLQLMFAALDEELERTEMYLSCFYGVVDRRAQTLRWANTGHPHAFIVDEDGEAERLPAPDPPLGMGETFPRSKTRPWAAGQHLLVLFTDGIADARDRKDRRFGEELVLELVRKHRKRPVEEIVDEVFGAVAKHVGRVPSRDDRTLLILRS